MHEINQSISDILRIIINSILLHNFHRTHFAPSSTNRHPKRGVPHTLENIA
jgi:hypothetical protein